MLEGADMLGGIGLDSTFADAPGIEDNRAETTQLRALQNAANNSGIVQDQMSLQQRINNSPRMVAQRKSAVSGGQGVIQKQDVFKDKDNTYSTFDDALKPETEFDAGIDKGSSATSLSYSADTNLPTPRKVLIDNFGAKVKRKKFWKQNPSQDHFDRPKKIMATIAATQFENRNDEVTTEIGTLGNDEIMIRDGAKPPKSFYDGGHLIGDKILGKHSRHPYNIAPQETVANEKYYNHTIENALRHANAGTTYKYEVKLDYKNHNYRVDQEHLVKNGILSDYVHNKPWAVYIPARIPARWSAKATLISGQSKFKRIENDQTGNSESMNTVDDAVYTKNDQADRSKFHLDQQETTITFDMGQYVPSTPPANPKKKENKAEKEANLDNPESYEIAKTKKDLLPKIVELTKSLPAKLEKIRASIEDNSYVDWLTKVWDTPTFEVDDDLYKVCVKDSLDKIKQLRNTISTTVNAVTKRKKMLSDMNGIGAFLDTAYDSKYDSLEAEFNTKRDAEQKVIYDNQRTLQNLLNEVKNAAKTTNDHKLAATTPDKLNDSQAMRMYDELDSIQLRLELWKGTDVNNCYMLIGEAGSELDALESEAYEEDIIKAVRRELNNRYIMAIATASKNDYMDLMGAARGENEIKNTHFGNMHLDYLESLKPKKVLPKKKKSILGKRDSATMIADSKGTVSYSAMSTKVAKTATTTSMTKASMEKHDELKKDPKFDDTK